MEKIVVTGGAKLTGRVKVDGAKNAVLPLIAASILAEKGNVTLFDVPSLDDVTTIIKLLNSLNVKTEFKENRLDICSSGEIFTRAPYELVSKMRASFIVMGPLLAREGHARVAAPGGCAIGIRPIDLHIKGLEALGATFNTDGVYVEGFVKDKLRGASIYLDMPSVGATQNIMMAASLAEGKTIIENAACEPEIIDLANFLNAMGAKIKGAGTGEIKIEGVEHLTGAPYTVIPDRIEAGTYMIAAAVTRGDVFVEGAIAEHLISLIAKLREMNVEVIVNDEGIRVKANPELKAIKVKTLPHPAFPTDLQSQMMALQLTASGPSYMIESVFENRFMHVEELNKMGANIEIKDRSAYINGPVQLHGAKVKATDLRSGAALILAGLVADGVTEVTETQHIYRGYVDIVGKLKNLGADIEVKENELV